MINLKLQSVDKQKKISINRLMISLLVMYTIIFPRDLINIKEILLFVTLFICSPSIYHGLKKKYNCLILFFGLIYPITEILISITIGNSSIADAISSGYVWLYLLLIPAIISYNLDLRRPFIFATTFIACLIVSICLLDILGIVSIYDNPISSFFLYLGEFQSLSKGALAVFNYNLYFKSSILLIFTLAFYLNKKNYLLSILCAFALFMTGARANTIGAFLVILFIPLLRDEKKGKKVFTVFFILAISMIFMPFIIDKLQTITNLKFSGSESIKIKGVQSTFNLLNKNKYMYIFGSGLGSYYFDIGRNTYVNMFEFSFIDYFRQVGIFGFILFVYFLIKPMKYLWKREKWVLLTFLTFLIVASTNPLLLNSTSFMGYLMIYTCAFSDQKYSLL